MLPTSQSGLLDRGPTAGVNYQQLPVRSRHISEGKLAFDLFTEVNRHTLHPGHTPVPDTFKYYSFIRLATSTI